MRHHHPNKACAHRVPTMRWKLCLWVWNHKGTCPVLCAAAPMWRAGECCGGTCCVALLSDLIAHGAVTCRFIQPDATDFVQHDSVERREGA